MLFSTLFVAASLALGVTSAPTENVAPGASFKFQVSQNGKTRYLTASGAGTSDPAQALNCIIEGSSLKCGKAPTGPFSLQAPGPGGDMIPLVMKNSRGSDNWSVDPSTGAISWGKVFPSNFFMVGKPVAFSFYKNTDNIYAEQCPEGDFFSPTHGHGHFVTHGTAKAVWN